MPFIDMSLKTWLSLIEPKLNEEEKDERGG